MKGANKPVSLFKQSAGQKLPNQLSKQQNLQSRHHVPSYIEINPDQLIVVQPIPLRHSAQDNDMWARIKFQMLPTQQLDSPFRHSSSSSTLTSCSSTDYYSPLPDFSLGVESSEMLVSSSSFHQLRPRSFSPSSPHHPFISPFLPLSLPPSPCSFPPVSLSQRLYHPSQCTEQPNGTPQGGSLHADLCNYSLATSSQVTFIPPTHTNPALNGGVGVEGDYMNPFPEGLLHTYSNEGDLLQQVSVGRGREESREQPWLPDGGKQREWASCGLQSM